MFRSLTNPISTFEGGVLAIFVGQETSQFIVGYRDNGIIFRSILGGSSQPTEQFQELLVRESSSTLSFVSAQLRGLAIEKLVLAGGIEDKEPFRDYLAGELSMDVDIAEPWDLWGIKGAGDKPCGWDAAIGLAVRNLK
jgi:type IV pilus assembly protein PilM